MGAINNNPAIYLNISGGKICKRLKSPSESSITRTTDKGTVVIEEQYSAWEGYITDIKTRESEYGKDWNVTIYDGIVTAILQFKYSSGYSRAFLKALPNVNILEKVVLTPKEITVDGKKRTTLFINQDGKAIKWKYTKDTPNGIPSPMKIKIKGIETYDDSNIMEFLENVVNTEVLPKLKEETPF